MNIVVACHSLLSDWNHGNAHFLRGIASELVGRGHHVAVYEPADSWSLQHLLHEEGAGVLAEFHQAYPMLESRRYEVLDLDEALGDADLVIVHEWNSHDLVARIGKHRARTRSYRLLFHDTHHRAVTNAQAMSAYELTHYDGVLAYGAVLRDLYLAREWTQRAWAWHEAADTRIFRPLPAIQKSRDLVWIGNWGDEERTAELEEFLVRPVEALRLQAKVFGVRYPKSARQRLNQARIDYAGWLPNFRAPEAFAESRVTVHVPRRPYARQLPGIPTIRPFEALACGIPLISAPWDDAESLFTPGKDYLLASNGAEMTQHLRAVLSDESLAQALAAHGLRTILERHTCVHRVDELMRIDAELRAP